MAAFRGQQHRWSKGSEQTALAVLPTVWRQRLPWRVKLEASAHLVGNLAHPLMVLLAVLMPWIPVASRQLGWHSLAVLDGLVWVGGLGSLALFYGVAAHRAGQGVGKALCMLPAVIAVGAGISVNNSAGFLGAMLHLRSPFVRTPKRGGQVRARYRAALGALPVGEILLAAWLLYGIGGLAEENMFLEGLMPLLFALGLLWVSAGSLRRVFSRTQY